jgi:hypothetical protein
VLFNLGQSFIFLVQLFYLSQLRADPIAEMTRTITPRIVLKKYSFAKRTKEIKVLFGYSNFILIRVYWNVLRWILIYYGFKTTQYYAIHIG